MNKSVINRILKLEKQIPIDDFDINEYIQQTITLIESILQYEIKNKIKLSKPNYISKDMLNRAIFRCLTVEELRTLAYSSDNKN